MVHISRHIQMKSKCIRNTNKTNKNIAMIQLKPVCTTYLFMQPVLDEKDTNKAGERLASATGLLLRDSLHYLNILMFCELSIGKAEIPQWSHLIHFILFILKNGLLSCALSRLLIICCGLSNTSALHKQMYCGVQKYFTNPKDLKLVKYSEV